MMTEAERDLQRFEDILKGVLKVPGTNGRVRVVWLTALDVARGCDCGAGMGNKET